MLFQDAESPQDGGGGGDGKVVRSLFSEAIKGADAYAMIRRAVRCEGDRLRVGNRFLRTDTLKEVAFIASGHAATPMASALLASLGDMVTQGLLISPSGPPPQFPFRHKEVTEPLLPSEEGAAAARDALELVAGLGPSDLLIPLLSPGTLGMLALPPETMEVGAYRDLIRKAVEKGLLQGDLLALVRGLSRSQGGWLAEATGGAPVEALVVERGDGGDVVGAGPFSLPPPDNGERARHALRSLGEWDPLDASTKERVLSTPRLDRSYPGQPRTVTVGGPADAFDAMGAECATRHHRPKLFGLHDTSGPGIAAAKLVGALETEARGSREAGSKGLAVMGGLTLGAPEGGESSALLETFLREAGRLLPRRGVTLAALYTGGSIRPGLARSMGTVDAQGPPKMSEMKGGFTDVGTIALAWYDLP